MTDAQTEHHANHADESARAESGGVVQINRIEVPGLTAVANLLIVIILAFVLTIPFSIYAVVKVELYQDKVTEQIKVAERREQDRIADLERRDQERFGKLDTDMRLAAYWGERAEIAMTSRGIPVPPYPARNPKEKKP